MHTYEIRNWFVFTSYAVIVQQLTISTKMHNDNINFSQKISLNVKIKSTQPLTFPSAFIQSQFFLYPLQWYEITFLTLRGALQMLFWRLSLGTTAPPKPHESTIEKQSVQVFAQNVECKARSHFVQLCGSLSLVSMPTAADGLLGSS